MQLKQWSKRKLSSEGKIIIAKTFGLSQIIYHLQNTTYEPKHLKEIENIVYKFIWNGPDKIKREIIKKDFNQGGLKGPDILSLDKTLKLKQVLRAGISNHSIKYAQKLIIDLNQPTIRGQPCDQFSLIGQKEYHLINKKVISDIILDCKGVSKDHIYRLGKIDINQLKHLHSNLGPLEMPQIRNECKLSLVKKLTSTRPRKCTFYGPNSTQFLVEFMSRSWNFFDKE
jgi:hypothetical protein